MKRVLVLVTWLCACGGAQQVPVPSTPARTVSLVPSEQLGRDFVAQQKLHGTYGEKEFSLDAVLQLAHGKLTLIGLTPFGSRAFVLQLSGSQVKLEKFIDRDLPFDPRFVLDDVQRVFFRALADANPDGTSVAELLGERVTETRVGGHPTSRTFERLDGQPKGKVEITFASTPSPVVSPDVTLVNGWYGYTLRVTTLSQQYLP